jgi:hypothetical protein
MVIQKLLSGRPHCSKIDLRKEMPSLWWLLCLTPSNNWPDLPIIIFLEYVA